VLSYYPLWLALAASAILLFFWPFLQFVAQLVACVVFLLFVLWRRPLEHVWKLVLTVVTMLVAVIGINLGAFLAGEAEDGERRD
jgi:hypothetical protein